MSSWKGPQLRHRSRRIQPSLSEVPKCRSFAITALTPFLWESKFVIPNWLYTLFVLLFELYSSRHYAQIRFLQAQVDILRKKLPGNRVILDPADRLYLPRLGAELNPHRMWRTHPGCSGGRQTTGRLQASNRPYGRLKSCSPLARLLGIATANPHPSITIGWYDVAAPVN